VYDRRPRLELVERKAFIEVVQAGGCLVKKSHNGGVDLACLFDS
jgi:hypothetical protein